MDKRTTYPSLGRRLLGRYALTVVATLLALAFVLDRTLEAMFLDDLTDSLVAQARAVHAALPEDPEALQSETRALGQRLDIRITIIGADGEVLADSVRDPVGIENHAGRTEVRAALDGRTGIASRTSETTGEPYRYVALPQEDGIVVRVALPLSIVQERLERVRTIVIVGTAIAAVVGVLAVWLVARGLTRPLRNLTESVERISRGDLITEVPVGGTSEVAVLGRTLERMSRELDARVEELKRDRKQQEVILSSMGEGVALVDAGGAIGYANLAAARLLGTDSKALPASLRRLVDSARGEGHVLTAEVDVDSPTRTLQASAVPLQDPGEILIVLRDITAERRLEAMRRDFVTDASHELKTPTAAIRAAAETVEKAIGEDPVAAERFAVQLRRDATRLSHIVSDLLDLSRLESHRPDLEEVRLDELVADEVRRSREQAKEAGVEIDWTGAPVTVRGSGEDLSLLARNLLDNAIRYTPRGGRVSVEVRGDNGSVSFSVSDTGIGIPSRDLPRIFERFYRVDRARSRDTGGTGLGLSIARHVVERHGGRIEAESELGQGSKFVVTLPAGAG